MCFAQTLDANSWVVIVTLAGAVAFLAKILWARQIKTEEKLEECESDRTELWKTIASQGEKIAHVEGRQDAAEEFKRTYDEKITEVHKNMLALIKKDRDE